MSLLLISANLTASMDAAMIKKNSPQIARNKNSIGHCATDPGKASKKKVTKKNWTLAQTGGCGS